MDSMADVTKTKPKHWFQYPEDVQYNIVVDLENGISRADICEKYSISLKVVRKIYKYSDEIKEKREKAEKPSGPLLVEQGTSVSNPVHDPCPPSTSRRPPIILRIKLPPRQPEVKSDFALVEPVGRPKRSIPVVKQEVLEPVDTPKTRKRVNRPKISKSKESPRVIKKEENPQIVKKEESPQIVKKEEYEPVGTPLRPSGNTADWDHILEEVKNLKYIAPVTMFKHAPLRDIWKDVARVGRVLEVPNPFVRCKRPVNWYATVVRFAGYKALVEFQCFDVEPAYVSWMSFCSDIPKQIGFSEKNSILLHPPHQVRAKYPDYYTLATDALFIGSKETIPEHHGLIIRNELKKCQKYPLNTVLEVLDVSQISRMRLGRVTCLVGDRIHVSYLIENGLYDQGFWFSVHSDLIHPLGWSVTVDHEIYGVATSTKFVPLGKEHFPNYPDNVKLEPGQYLEVRHPVQPYRICAAVVHRVLKYGYFIVEINVLVEEIRAPTRFTYHITSPYVFYCGFCETHGIPITPPHGESERFTWDDYIRRRNVVKAPLNLVPPRSAHKFKPGMKLEIVDIVEPTILGPGTILRSAAHLLYIHFDGWRREHPEDNSEYWMDAESPDIYPVGFAEMVGHDFNGCGEHIDPAEFPEPNSSDDEETETDTEEENSRASR